MEKTLLSILAGLGGMFGWGISDFFANNASEKIGHSKTFFWSQIAGLLLITIMILVLKPSFIISPLFWIIAISGGIFYTIGYLLFYKAFEIGNVSVVSAVVNLQTLFVIIISFLRGQTLSSLQILAITLLLIGVTIVSVNFNDLRKGTISLLKGVKETLLATIMFGIFYWPLNEFVVEQNDWLAIGLITKIVAVTFVFLISLRNKNSLSVINLSQKLIILIALVGILEAIAVLSVTFGQAYGDGIIVAPISSALTIVTVGLAMIFSKEKITRVQGLGIAVVIIGIVITAF
jgi:drug/metabolite transporter (DMT)-like permease